MIPNIIIPMPMPIYGGGSFSSAAIIASLVAFFALGLVLYIGGYLYEGIRHGDWSLGADNEAKFGGIVTMAVTLCAAFVFLVIGFLLPILEK